MVELDGDMIFLDQNSPPIHPINPKISHLPAIKHLRLISLADMGKLKSPDLSMLWSSVY